MMGKWKTFWVIGLVGIGLCLGLASSYAQTSLPEEEEKDGVCRGPWKEYWVRS